MMTEDKITVSFPNEIAVLVTCAQRRPPKSALARAGAHIEDRFDWDILEYMATRHAVVPLVKHSLGSHFPKKVPKGVLDGLGVRALDYARHNIVQLQNLIEATTLLAEAEIPSITFKGLIQSQLAYGDIATRWAGDIDLLVHECHFKTARDLFVASGFERLLLEPMEYKLCESGLWHEDERIKVDLHFGIAPDHFHIDAERFWQNKRSVSVAGSAVNGFSAVDNLIVLCTNAVKEYWSQLLYRYCDIHELVSGYGRDDWKPLFTRADTLGCRRITELALLVTHRLFGTPSLDGVPAVDRPARAIGRAAEELIAQMFYADDTDQEMEARAPLFYFSDKQRYTIVLRDKRSRRLAERLNLVFAPNRFDQEFIRLPSALSPVYYLVRPVRLATEFARSLPARLGRQHDQR